MAYVSFADPTLMPLVGPAESASAPAASLSALEWSVVALAERDHPSSLRAPGRLAIALGRLFGEQVNPRLADPQLEALRRMAVLSWHYGYVVPSEAIRDFVAAGFTLGQYELMLDSIEGARAKRHRPRAA